MPDEFNPYHIWLGIPPEDQPPHHYRLLGVKAFETNPDVLESAADQRMVHVRSFQGGKHSAESQKLLNELAAARLCLLSPEKRQAYDRVLKSKLAAEKPAAAPPAPSPPAHPTPNPAPRPLANARPLTPQTLAVPAQPTAALDFDPLEQTPARRPPKRRASNQSPAIYAGVGIGLLAVTAVVWIAIGSGGEDQPIAARDPVAHPKVADTGSRRDEHPAPVQPAGSPTNANNDQGEAQGDPKSSIDPADSSPPDESPVGPDQPADDLSDEMPVATADDPDGVGTGEAPVDDRAEPPTVDQIAAAVTEIQRVLRDDYSAAKKPAERTALAEKLLALVPDCSDASERYALLTEARRLAIAANNPALALQAADALAESFAVERFELLAKTAEELAARELSTAARKEFVEAIEPLVEQALAAGQFAPGRRLAALGLAAARKTNQAEIAKTLTRLGKELAAGEKLAASAADARTRLEQNPDDPQANETLGKYLCLYAGDWSAGLPHLVRSDDPVWRATAELEMAADESPNTASKIADAWWELAQKEADIARDSLRLHAGELYKAALPNLTSTLRKTVIEKRLADISDLRPFLAAAAADNPTGAIKFPLGRWVNVLSLVDTTKNVVEGNWSRTGNELDVAQGRESRIAIPVAVDGSYDLEVGFNRLQGIGEVRVRIPVGPGACDVEWSQESRVSGLDMLDGRHAVDDRNPTKVSSPDLQNGHVYRLFIMVRLRGPDRATIDVLLDGKPFLPHWEGNPSALAVGRPWIMPTRDHLGLCAFASKVRFGVARLRMVTGHASAAVAPSARPKGSEAQTPLRFAKWIYPADENGKPGYFEQRGAEWIEAKEGKVVAHFKESARTAGYVELFDQGRGLWVRLKPTEYSFSRDQAKWFFIARGTPAAD